MDYLFRNPASEPEIAKVEEELKIQLHNDLSCLLRETNGVSDKNGCPLIWSTNQIIKENRKLRNQEDFEDLYMPLDCLLFFSDAGNGDLFGYSIHKGSIQKDDVYVWNHENDSRTWVAPSLEKFVEWWTNGMIKV